MRFRRHRPERRTPQNIFALVRSNQIDQVGVAIGELLHFDARRALGQVLVQIIRQRRAVEFFAAAGPPRYRIQMPRVSMGSMISGRILYRSIGL